MAIIVKHAKTNNIPAWTQADLDIQIAAGNFPPGTTLADITLSTDWNTNHQITGLGALAELNTVSVDGVTIIGNGVNIPLSSVGDGDGNVKGPASSTDNAITRFDGTSGKIIQNSNASLTDGGMLILAPQSGVGYTQGGLFYDSDNESLTFFNNDADISLQIGQEEWIRVVNNSGTTIANGRPVYSTGASAGMPTVALANANALATAQVIGITTESIANGAVGFATTYGTVRGVDTSAFASGANLFLATTAGTFTTTAPASPNQRVRVGIVGVSNATTGTIIMASPTNTLGFGAANQLLAMNTAGTANEYKTVSSTTSITAVQAAGALSFQRAALTGDITSPVNSNATTLATVNANVGSFGSASSVMTQTVNAKGLTTAAASVAIQIAESQVTNLVSDLAAKQGTITLTTTGTSGAATLIGNTLNIPNYASGGGTVTNVSGTTNRIVVTNPTTTPVIDIGTDVVTLTGTQTLTNKDLTTGNTFPTFNQNTTGSAATLTTTRSISATGDATWSVNFNGSTNATSGLTLATVNANIGTFNNVTVNAKGLVTAASNVAYLTGNQTITISGEASGSGSTAISLTLNNASVIGKLLTGFTSGAGSISATDSILTAIQKLNGNDALKQTLVTLTTTGTGAATFNQGTGALNIPTPVSSFSPPVRQTVLQGPVTTAGLPDFLPATSASLSITSQNVSTGLNALIITAATGTTNNTGMTTTNLTWTGLTASTTNFLYVDIDTAGVITTGSTTVLPIYQWGGTPAVTANQFTFNIQQMASFVGNGTVANQAGRVFVGEAVTNATTVTNAFGYAYMGRYQGAYIATLPAVAVNTIAQHNIGTYPRYSAFEAECTAATDGDFLLGEKLNLIPYKNSFAGQGEFNPVTRNQVRTRAGDLGWTGCTVGGGTTPLTLASWKRRHVAERGW